MCKTLCLLFGMAVLLVSGHTVSERGSDDSNSAATYTRSLHSNSGSYARSRRGSSGSSMRSSFFSSNSMGSSASSASTKFRRSRQGRLNSRPTSSDGCRREGLKCVPDGCVEVREIKGGAAKCVVRAGISQWDIEWWLMIFLILWSVLVFFLYKTVRMPRGKNNFHQLHSLPE